MDAFEMKDRVKAVEDELSQIMFQMVTNASCKKEFPTDKWEQFRKLSLEWTVLVGELHDIGIEVEVSEK